MKLYGFIVYGQIQGRCRPTRLAHTREKEQARGQDFNTRRIFPLTAEAGSHIVFFMFFTHAKKTKKKNIRNGSCDLSG